MGKVFQMLAWKAILLGYLSQGWLGRNDDSDGFGLVGVCIDTDIGNDLGSAVDGFKLGKVSQLRYFAAHFRIAPFLEQYTLHSRS